jgi:hypothetical protein
MKKAALLLALFTAVRIFAQGVGPGGAPGANSTNATALQSIPVSSTPPTLNYCLVYNGTQWVSASCSASAPVTSVFTRTGAVAATSGDYTVSQVTGAAPLASPALTGAPTAPTQTAGDSSTDIATDAFVATAITPLAPLASPTFTGTPAAPTPTTSDNSTKVATTAYVQSVQADPYLQRTQTLLFDDYYSTANNSANPIGSPTGSGCSANNVDSDINHPGNIVLTTGTGGTGTGETCGYQNASGAVHTLNLTPGWTWETDVYVPVLPGTTAASYQVGLSGNPNSNPWGTSILFYLSSANGVANDWYCKYSSTSVDTGVAAVASTWTVLRMASDGTNTHWYINGTEASGCVTASSNLTATSVYVASYAATALGSTSTTMAVDYVYFQRAVTR